MQPSRVAVYAGTFDPVTFGHLDVITKAAALVDVLHVLVAVNPQKATWFSIDERERLLRSVCPAGVRVASTQGMVVDFAKSVGATWLVRGVRSTTDATAELELAALNAGLAPDITTIFVTADPTLSEVSSSGLKAMAARGGALENVCPPAVAKAVRERLAQRRDASRSGDERRAAASS
ncbi:MAG: pantetheine-phosphate adenylyltransferase [Myxococcales bacterium]|nr:pantetheine-phosphate adenylyltransferase [Myxococcales bacterium]